VVFEKRRASCLPHRVGCPEIGTSHLVPGLGRMKKLRWIGTGGFWVSGMTLNHRHILGGVQRKNDQVEVEVDLGSSFRRSGSIRRAKDMSAINRVIGRASIPENKVPLIISPKRQQEASRRTLRQTPTKTCYANDHISPMNGRSEPSISATLD